ncbi:DUF2066 domain-containing protein [Maricaulis sp. D1M11]|uniref:DUF2066 domain-containing protein n=1 Tax=Maricaulis sp. D1M11 TaxID=3076117 RepID=UPI0039B4A746
MRVILSVLVLAFATIGPVQAQDPYTITGVAIDATADNAYEAQAAALRSGQAEAARRLVARLTLAEDRLETGLDESVYINEMGEEFSFYVLDDVTVAEMISGLEVMDERRSATRYLANLTVSFDPRAVERLMTRLGVPYVESQSRPLLVLPIYERNGSFELWTDNAWRRAWQSGGFEHALTPMFVPAGREGESVISARGALSLSNSGLRQLAALYGVDRMAILRARSEEIGENRTRQRLGGYLVDLSDAEEPQVETWGPVNIEGSWAETADAFLTAREDEWKRVSIVRDAELHALEVTVLYNALGEWRGLQSSLTGASLVEQARLDALSRHGALMTVTYRGAQEQLINELGERGLVLEEQPGLGWVAREDG